MTGNSFQDWRNRVFAFEKILFCKIFEGLYIRSDTSRNWLQKHFRKFLLWHYFFLQAVSFIAYFFFRTKEMYDFVYLCILVSILMQNILHIYLGDVLDAKAFDTHGDENAGKNLRDFLNSITGEWVTSKYLLHSFDFFNKLVFFSSLKDSEKISILIPFVASTHVPTGYQKETLWSWRDPYRNLFPLCRISYNFLLWVFLRWNGAIKHINSRIKFLQIIFTVMLLMSTREKLSKWRHRTWTAWNS